MDIPTIKLTQQEFDALPVSENAGYDQARCRAKSSTGQWLFIDRDSVPSAAVIEISDAPEKVVLFTLPPKPAAAVPPATEPEPFEAREAVPPATTDVEKAHAAFATISVCLIEHKERVLHLLNGVRQVPPQMQTRRNKRVLVFLDALEDMAELIEKDLPLAPEAVEWWNARNGEVTLGKEMRSDMRRLADLVADMEKEAGMTAQPGAEQLRPIDKIEDMTVAMRQALEQQAAIIKQLRTQLAAALKKN
jgi:hypothetical protein